MQVIRPDECGARALGFRHGVITRSKFWPRLVVSCAAIGLAAATGWFANPRDAAAACDTQCRLASTFKYCGGKCVAHLNNTCLLCGGTGSIINGGCVDTGTSALPYCNRQTGGTTRYTYDDCDPSCDCTGKYVVQAAELGAATTGVSAPHYDCMGYHQPWPGTD